MIIHEYAYSGKIEERRRDVTSEQVTAFAQGRPGMEE
ncbi:MAG: hypothetical protein AVDCRST_MAG80-1737 [uncultured Rubrobacteraceae bacterium]|uniref:Uncharacterized protein n=1 Tax=uncultured Rubrobacteraceae bacterium TaxID=349277 RepID=A0A6J4QI21_9ACTN|nr:MAG: hypothetical protein AVDCRST_MAG80-1737 [uncultured Rubrobacteraceae bacterium]